MGILPAIQNRYSVRDFTDEKVDDEALERILEAGRIAPSAKNRQPWRFVLIRDQILRDKIGLAAYNEPWVSKAPAIVAICSTNIDYKLPNGQLAYPIDLTFSASFMMLQAVYEDLGCCINTTFEENEVRELLTVPYSMRVVMLLIIGHPAEKKNIEHERLPRNRIVNFEHW